MKNGALLFLITLSIFASTTEARRLLDPNNCLADFTARAAGANYDELTELAQALTKRDLKCLHSEASKNGSPSLAFFTPMARGDAKDVAILFGKNSLPLLNTFEKHIFSSRSNLRAAGDNATDLFGYNFHFGMTITGPGFFKVKQGDASMLIDFTDDFVSEIASDEMASISGIKTVATRNNHGNIFYGGETRDYCVRLLYDEEFERDIAVVCEGYRSFFGHRHAFIWDILIRKWD